MKYMLHARRQKLTLEDVNMALQARSLEPLHGYDPTEPLNYRLVPNTQLFYTPSEEIDLETFLQEPLPKAPAPMSVTSHWLAVEGVQPAIPENPTRPDRNFLGEPLASAATVGVPLGVAAAGIKGSTDDVELKGPVKHVLSREQQLLYDTLINDLFGADTDINKIDAALLALEGDAGLQSLLPFFLQYLADSVPRNLRNLDRLLVLMRLARSLLVNPHLFMEPYLHQLLPPVLTCLLGKRLCEHPETEPHWSLRLDAADVIGYICRVWGPAYQTIVPRVTRTFAKTLSDPERPLTSHFGAIVGLTALGPMAVQSVLIPVLPAYLRALGIEGTPMDGGEQLPLETRKCYEALCDAVQAWRPHASEQDQAAIAPFFQN